MPAARLGVSVLPVRYFWRVEVQGLILIVFVLGGMAHLVSYLYRRRRLLSEARLEERFAENLRMLPVTEDSPAVDFRGDHGSVFERPNGRNEVKMPPSRTNGTAVTVRILARERARRRARIALRRANRTRGLAGGGLLAAVAVLLWILYATDVLSMWVPVAVTVLCVLYAAGFAYLLQEMAKATRADLAAIEDLSRRLVRARGANREIARRRAKAARAKRAARRTEAMPASKRAPAGAPEAAERKPEAKREPKPVRAKPASAARPAKDLPSYTLKHSTVPRRSIEPYKAPRGDEAPVPYRPKALGETVAKPSDGVRWAVALTPESAESLAGGSALDALLDRRRA